MNVRAKYWRLILLGLLPVTLFAGQRQALSQDPGGGYIQRDPIQMDGPQQVADQVNGEFPLTHTFKDRDVYQPC